MSRFAEVPAVDFALLRKYDQPGPRYTSYPTAPHFHEGFGADAFAAKLRASGEEGPGGRPAPLSLYFHIPFCESLCWFCGCNMRVSHDLDRAARYLDALALEMAVAAPLLGAERREVRQLHWGGGTPTFLRPAYIERLAREIRARFRIAEGAELGVEIDPRRLQEEHVAALGAAGFNRLSMGLQDLDERVQRAVNRVQSEEETRRAIEWGRAHGMTSVNVDLIYGLPHQTPDSFARTLERSIDLDADRFAVFNFAYIPQMIKHQKVIDRDALPAPEMKLEMLRLTIEMLTGAGYVFIGMDHFAKRDDELSRAQREGTLHRNFQGYTTHKGLDLLGLGISAISQVGDCYAQNGKDLIAYEKTVASGRLATWRGIELTADDRLRRDVIMELLCHFALDKAAIEKRHAISFDERFADAIEALRPFERDGLVRLDAERIEVTNLGRLLVRNVCMPFDARLGRAKDRPLFSRTV